MKREGKKKGVKRHGATIKQRKFVKALLATGNQREAAMQAYNTKSRHNAGQVAKAMLKSPNVQAYMKQCLDAAGLGIEDSATVLQEIIDDNKEGKPSQAVRLAAITTVLRLHDTFPANKTISANLKINPQTAPLDMPELQKTLENMNKTNELLLQELKK